MPKYDFRNIVIELWINENYINGEGGHKIQITMDGISIE